MDATELKTEACRSCHAPILWAKHITTGKAAPLDAATDLNGNCVLYDNGTYAVLRTTDTIAAPERMHTNHFQTCKDAKKWSRK